MFWPRRTIPLTLIALLCVGCARPVVMPPEASAPAIAPAATPAMSARQAWLATDSAALVAALPPLPGELPAAPAAPVDPSALAAWAEPASGWMGVGLGAIVADTTSPVRAARALMLLGVAMNDGLLAGAVARAQGLEIADDALLAAAASRVLASTHPLRAVPLAADIELATWAGVWQGEATVAGVLNGRQLGAAVADAVLAWAAQDGALSLDPTIQPPAAQPGVWAPTGPTFESPDTPEWGQVRSVAVRNLATVRAPAPPAWESAAMRATYADFVAAQRALSDADRALARHWAAGVGSVTPPGMWVQIARDLIAAHNVGTPAAAAIYAALGVALHDSAVACWESKYTYWLARPQQAMQATDPGWKPLIKTPPHPAYPSGHATFSGAASTLLAAAFPDKAAWLAQQAADAARSRVLGGIHWPIDGEAGLAQGRAVAEQVLARMRDE